MAFIDALSRATYRSMMRLYRYITFIEFATMFSFNDEFKFNASVNVKAQVDQPTRTRRAKPFISYDAENCMDPFPFMYLQVARLIDGGWAGTIQSPR